MTDRQAAIVKRSYKTRRKLRCVKVTYSDGTYSVQLNCIVGSTLTSNVYDDAGSQVRDTVRDYLILPEDLVLNRESIKPKPGHTITEEGGARYEVARIGEQPAWRWSDSTKQILRVHTQQIGGT